jgi:hypothetical protein
MMKTGARLVLLVALSLTAADSFAQEITFTTTAANLVASKATIDMPGLAGNPRAIIVATPLGDTATLNPHPVGAWYYNGKWNIFNADHATMPAGLKFKVRVFLRPDANQFVHVMTKENLSDGVSFIDHPALNGKPDAQLAIFQNHAPDNRSGYLNKYEAKAEYDPSAGRWFIKNVGGERLFPNTAYNVVISSEVNRPATTGDNPANLPKLSVTIPELNVKAVVNDATAPASPTGTVLTPPSTFAQTQPAPPTVVVREEWAIPYQGNILLSSGLCKIVNGSYANSSILATDTVIVTGQSASEGAYLKWTATVDNGAIHLNVCNWKKMTLNATAAMDLNGRKVNILVLR